MQAAKAVWPRDCDSQQQQQTMGKPSLCCLVHAVPCLCKLSCMSFLTVFIAAADYSKGKSLLSDAQPCRFHWMSWQIASKGFFLDSLGFH